MFYPHSLAARMDIDISRNISKDGAAISFVPTTTVEDDKGKEGGGGAENMRQNEVVESTKQQQQQRQHGLEEVKVEKVSGIIWTERMNFEFLCV